MKQTTINGDGTYTGYYSAFAPKAAGPRRIRAHPLRPLILLLLILVLSIQPSPSHAQDDSLTLGIFPRRNAALTIELFTPLAKHLAIQLDRQVKLVTAKDFPSFWERLDSGEYDLVHYNQYHYLKTSDRYQVIARNEEFGRRTIKGGIYVRRDSNIDSLEQLRGKHIAFGGGKQAMMSYIVPHYLLREAGLNPGDFQEKIARNPPNSIMAAFYRQVDAAGAGSAAFGLPSVRKSIPVEDVIPLAESEELYHLPWAVNRALPASLRDEIQLHLVSLKESPEGHAVLEAARLTDLLTAIDTDYDSCRIILESMDLLDKSK